MSSSEAELTLIINARNLATKTVDGFKTSVAGIGQVAEKATATAGRAFRSLHEGITNGLGNLTENLAQGAGLGESLFMFGAYMAGQAAESFIGTMLERMAGSSLVAAIGGPIAAAGSALGSVISAAIPIGMALLPVLVLAAIVAAIVFLINNPEIVNKVLEVAGGIVKFLIDGIAGLPMLLFNTFAKAFELVTGAVGPFVGGLVAWFLGIPGKLIGLGASIVTTIINGLASLPGKVADAVREAFANLKIDIGPFHIRSTGVTIDLPNIAQDPRFAGQTSGEHYTGHAAGGWAGLHGPELSWLGEKGPEYVRRAGTGTGDEGGPGVRIQGISERELLDMVDRGLYFRLQRAAASRQRI